MNIEENIARGWALIDGSIGHRVTLDGRIQSRYIKNRPGALGDDWYDMSLSLDKRGYPLKIISLNGKMKCGRVHRYVARYFVANDKLKSEVNHIDGDKKNNHYTNLEWLTCKENINHAIVNGLRGCFKGSGNGIAKLKEEQIPTIRNMISLGISNAEVGRMYGVTRSTIYKIKYGISWTHV